MIKTRTVIPKHQYNGEALVSTSSYVATIPWKENRRRVRMAFIIAKNLAMAFIIHEHLCCLEEY